MSLTTPAKCRLGLWYSRATMQIRTDLRLGFTAQQLCFRNGVCLQVEVAATPEEQSQGLMGRTALAENAGMWFVFAQPGRASFWMANTSLPLDVGFFTADGVLREVQPLTPFDLTIVRSARADIAFALEVNRGWFAQHWPG